MILIKNYSSSKNNGKTTKKANDRPTYSQLMRSVSDNIPDSGPRPKPWQKPVTSSTFFEKTAQVTEDNTGELIAMFHAKDMEPVNENTFGLDWLELKGMKQFRIGKYQTSDRFAAHR